MKRPHILLLGQYPLETLNTAPKVRTWSIWQALQTRAEVTFITGTRASRRQPLQELMRQGNLGRFDAVYLEAATSTSMELDLLLLHRLKRAGVPIGIYIRDAYPLFGMAVIRNFKERLLDIAWHVSQWSYRQLADVLFFPTRTLADSFDFPRKELLPPAARPELLPEPAAARAADTILYAGYLSDENGWHLLAPAMAKLHAYRPSARLLALTPTELAETPPWLELRRGVLTDVLPDLPRIAAAVVPRPRTAYNDLALPIKLMDYLSLGLPVIATSCRETAELIRADQLGLTCEDTSADLAAEMLRLLENPALARRLAARVQQAVRAKHSWEHRADHLLRILVPGYQSEA